MAVAPSRPQLLSARTSTHFMSLATSKLPFRSLPLNLKRCFCTPIIHSFESNNKSNDKPNGVKVKASASELVELKDNWLGSLSCPFQPLLQIQGLDGIQHGEEEVGGKWVIVIDPDISGALALLKDDYTAQVFDTPYLQVPVGKRVRKRLNARSIVQLLHSFKAPLGMI